MSPPIPKDWWLAAALTGAALPSALAQSAPAAGTQPAGVVTGAQQGKPAMVQPLYMDAARGQRVVTGPGQTVHVLFPDQSALTVGPGSEVVISQLEYNPQDKSGSIVVNMTKGLLRVVGGFISKRNEIQVRTATATVGIRGGISTVESDGESNSATFLFGQQMHVTDNNGNNRQITRPGFGVSFGSGGLGEPRRSSTSSLQSQLNRLGTGGGGGGGGGQGGGTLPGGGTSPDDLAPDRHQARRDGNVPNQQGANSDLPPDLKDILGGQSSPGNQS